MHTELTESPAVSVVMSVFNGEAFLAEAVESILAQTFTDFEFLIIDDGSTDKTAEILSAYAKRDNRVRVVTQENRGRTASLNRGIELAKAPLIARMDADDISLPHRLKDQLDFLNSHPEVGLLSGAYDQIDANGTILGPVYYPLEDSEIRLKMLEHNTMCHPAVMMRKGVVVSLGGYRTSFSESEDYDLWLRMAERTQLANLDRVILKYRVHRGQVSILNMQHQTWCVLAARAAASLRRSGKPDPLSNLEEVTPASLAALGVTEDETRSALIGALKHCIWLLRQSDPEGAIQVNCSLSRLSNSGSLPRSELANLWLKSAVAQYRRGEPARALFSAGRGLLIRPIVAGRPVKRAGARLAAVFRIIPAPRGATVSPLQEEGGVLARREGVKKYLFIMRQEAMPWGGSEVLWASAAEHLARQGNDVCVSAKDWGAPVPQVERLRSVGCRIALRPRRHRVGEFVVRQVRKILPRLLFYETHIRRFGGSADLVVISQTHNVDGLEWLEAARAAGRKYAVISQAAVVYWWPEDEAAERLRDAYNNAGAAFFVSQDNLEITRRQLGTQLRNARVVRQAFNVRYDACPPWPPAPDGELALACVARLDTRHKGQDLLLDVLALPHWRERRVRLSLFGKGPNEQGLRRMAELLGLSNVEFCGKTSDIEAVWAKHHALVLATRFEGMSLAVIEAMLCGRPCITTDVGGNRELIVDNANGFIAKAPTVELFDEALNRAWENRDRLREIGAAAARDVRERIPRDPGEELARELSALPETGSEAIRMAARSSIEPSR